MYKKNLAYRIEKALEYHRTIVNLPCSSNLTRENVDYVAEMIKQIEKEIAERA
jgi:perosamine synthetase